MRKKKAISILLVLTLIMLLAGEAVLPAKALAATASAISITLSSQTGSGMTITNSAGRSVSARDGMRLYSGYSITTKSGNYVYLSLDSSKAVKLDQNTRVQIQKEGTKNVIKVFSGQIFFNVSKKLSGTESFEVSTSTMSMGIRGTSGVMGFIPGETGLENTGGSDILGSDSGPTGSFLQIYDGKGFVSVMPSAGNAVQTGSVLMPGNQIIIPPDGRVIESPVSADDMPSIALQELAAQPQLYTRVSEAMGELPSEGKLKEEAELKKQKEENRAKELENTVKEKSFLSEEERQKVKEGEVLPEETNTPETSVPPQVPANNPSNNGSGGGSSGNSLPEPSNIPVPPQSSGISMTQTEYTVYAGNKAVTDEGIRLEISHIPEAATQATLQFHWYKDSAGQEAYPEEDKSVPKLSYESDGAWYLWGQTENGGNIEVGREFYFQAEYGTAKSPICKVSVRDSLLKITDIQIESPAASPAASPAKASYNKDEGKWIIERNAEEENTAIITLKRTSSIDEANIACDISASPASSTSPTYTVESVEPGSGEEAGVYTVVLSLPEDDENPREIVLIFKLTYETEEGSTSTKIKRIPLIIEHIIKS